MSKQATGNCYEAAVRYVWDHGKGRNLTICHGRPMGQGPIEGIRHGHAWVEETVTLPFPNGQSFPLIIVNDVSNGKDIQGMPAALYYSIGKIEGDEVRRYTLAEATAEMLRTKHFGPWE